MPIGSILAAVSIQAQTESSRGQGVTLAGVSSGGPTEDIEDMTADQIRVEIQEVRGFLGGARDTPKLGRIGDVAS